MITGSLTKKLAQGCFRVAVRVLEAALVCSLLNASARSRVYKAEIPTSLTKKLLAWGCLKAAVLVL